MERIISLALSAILLITSMGFGRDALTPSKDPPLAASAEPSSTEEPAKTPHDLWKEVDLLYPALRAATSRQGLLRNIYDPSAYGIDPDALIEIPSGTAEECDQYYAELRRILNRVCEVDRSRLEEADQFAFNTVTESLKADLKNREYVLYDDPFLANDGMHVWALSNLVVDRIDSEKDVARYIDRIAYIPTFLDKLLTREKERVEKGFFMTEYALDKTLKEIEQIHATDRSLFGGAELSAAMDRIGMTEAEQAPYLEKYQAAVDALFDAYGTLYAELSGMRASCEDPRTPYDNVPSVKNNRWFAAYQARLAPIFGTQDQTPEDTLQFVYEMALSLMRDELGRTKLTAGESASEEEQTVQALYEQTAQRLQERYSPLQNAPVVQKLPEIGSSFLGVIRFAYYYDQPQRSVLFINNRSKSHGVVSRYLACNNYFFLYFAQQPELSRAQLMAAPDTYYSGLGFYAALNLCKEDALRTGDNGDWSALATIVYRYMAEAYAGNLIAGGASEENVKRVLEYLHLPKDMADSIYESARANPLSSIQLTYGYAYFLVLHELCSSYLGDRMTEQRYMEQYLSYGPSFPHMVGEKMIVWCQALDETADA